MHTLHAQITCSFRGASRVETERSISIDQKSKERFFPPIQSGQGRGLPQAYLDEMVKVVCSILRDAFFPDEITPVETLDDLKRIGVDYLNVIFTFDGRDTLLMPLIE